MSEALESQVHGLVSKGDIPGAIKELDAELARAPRDVPALRLRASLHALGQDWRRVAEDLGAVAALDPQARLSGALANALERLGNHAAALAEYDRELRANPTDAFLLRCRAESRRDAGDLAGAKEDLLKAVRIQEDDPDPLFADYLLALANVEAGLGDDNEALRHLDAAVERGDWRHRLNRGALRAKLQRWEEAETDMDAVVFEIADRPAIASALAQALSTRAWAKFCQGKRDALDDAEEALRLSPDGAGALAVRGFIRVLQKDPRAAGDLDRALALDPELALAHAYRGEMLLEAGDKAAALREYRKAVALEPGLAATFAESIRRAGG